MKTGIIGLPQVGKTSLFRILTKVNLSEQAFSNPREAHIGVAKVPDERLDKLAALYKPKKLTHASVEYVDVGAIRCATSRMSISTSWSAILARSKNVWSASKKI